MANAVESMLLNATADNRAWLDWARNCKRVEVRNYSSLGGAVEPYSPRGEGSFDRAIDWVNEAIIRLISPVTAPPEQSMTLTHSEMLIWYVSTSELRTTFSLQPYA